MQTAVTVVNLIHDTVTETDRPVCWVFAGCSWRECRSTSGSVTAKDPERTTHIRIPASVCTAGYLPYAQWAALSAAEKATRLEAGAGCSACLDRSRVRQTRKNAPVLHSGGCLGRPRAAAAPLARGRELIA